MYNTNKFFSRRYDKEVFISFDILDFISDPSRKVSSYVYAGLTNTYSRNP